MLGVVNIVGCVNVDAADRIDQRLHAVEADLGIVGNLNTAQLVDRLDHGLGAANGMAGVDLHGRALVLDLGVARNGDERRLLLRGVDTRQDNRVGTVRILARTTVSAKEQHVERILCLVGINQDLAQVVGNDIGIAELAHNGGKPQAGGGSCPQQHAKHAMSATRRTVCRDGVDERARNSGRRYRGYRSWPERRSKVFGRSFREGLFLKHRQPVLVDDGIGDSGVLDMSAKRLQLFDKLLVAALDVMDGRNLGRPVGDQARTTRAAPPRRSGEVTCAPEKPLTP